MPYVNKYATLTGESDSESEDGCGRTVLSEATNSDSARRDENMKGIMMADLGSVTRRQITESDFGRSKQVNLKLLYSSRDCNQAGTEAAKLAAENKSELAEWSNFVHTDEAKDADVENLPDIAAGNTHRQEMRFKLESLRLQKGGELNLRDVESDKSHRRGIPLLPTHRSQKPASGRVDLGTGAVRRGTSHSGKVAKGDVSTPRDRPLDPAVDQNRNYKYSSGPSYQTKNPVPKASPRKATQKKDTNARATLAVGSRRSESAKKTSQRTPRRTRPWPPPAFEAGLPLAPPEDFMAQVNKKFKSGVQPAPCTGAQPLVTTTSLQANNAATTNAPSKSPLGGTGTSSTLSSSANRYFLDRAGFRQPGLSPSKLTDGVPSSTELSGCSPLVSGDGDLLGLAISGVAAIPTDKALHTEEGRPASHQVDLMDLCAPENGEDTLLPEPLPKDQMVSIPKSDAVVWLGMKKYLESKDRCGLEKYLEDIMPHLGQTVQPSAPVGMTVEKPNLRGSHDSAGRNHVLPKSRAVQTTPSLAQSKWAAPCPTSNDTKPLVNPFLPPEKHLKTIQETSETNHAISDQRGRAAQDHGSNCLSKNLTPTGSNSAPNPFLAKIESVNTTAVSNTKPSGLSSSRFAATSYSPVHQASSVLHPLSSNVTFTDKTSSKASSHSGGFIFGDARNISRNPEVTKKALEGTGTATTDHGARSNSRKARHQKPGAGFDLLMKEIREEAAQKSAKMGG